MLLMGGDRKRMVTQILGDDKKEAVPETGPLHAVANELIDAVNAHDVEGVVGCLKAAYAHCSSEGSSGEG